MKQRIITTCVLLAAIASVPGCLTEEESEPTEDECSGVIDLDCRSEDEEEDDAKPTGDPEDDCYGWFCGLDPDRDR